MKDKIAIILAVLMIIGVSYGIGYYQGAKTIAKWGVNVLEELVNREKVEIDIDKEMLIRGIMQNRERIGGCLFIQNASLHNNEGN